MVSGKFSFVGGKSANFGNSRSRGKFPLCSVPVFLETSAAGRMSSCNFLSGGYLVLNAKVNDVYWARSELALSAAAGLLSLASLTFSIYSLSYPKVIFQAFHTENHSSSRIYFKVTLLGIAMLALVKSFHSKHCFRRTKVSFYLILYVCDLSVSAKIVCNSKFLITYSYQFAQNTFKVNVGLSYTSCTMHIGEIVHASSFNQAKDAKC